MFSSHTAKFTSIHCSWNIAHWRLMTWAKTCRIVCKYGNIVRVIQKWISTKPLNFHYTVSKWSESFLDRKPVLFLEPAHMHHLQTIGVSFQLMPSKMHPVYWPSFKLLWKHQKLLNLEDAIGPEYEKCLTWKLQCVHSNGGIYYYCTKRLQNTRFLNAITLW